ncbi:hypothetical protein HUB94_19175 [Paenibacillus cellulosilyticus]|uniref:hypothetical protein n=1 Tax=Paenibacillus cellulosilyticus TaxID=375489 RepID=UPI000D70FF38|nr:hypothetical protein [Paenibacillus cellulosilyticus]QKS42947.1 hypothetical protein HUB94_00145 [Paenibacillus cellulosilyticus]QKS43470.1 hypothetical protein HUB94_02810 [Paenibacillus cellulosilyticus]QKS46331.1 hypothetical protein HUB94_19175 [Paenibacillus cellulosilyticus]
MKAWYVSDPSNEMAQIVFAAKRSAAIQSSEARSWHDYIDIRATRMPEYDQFATEGTVPKQTLLEDGWWFECCGYKAEPRRRCCAVQTVEDNPIVIDDEVYCQDCAAHMQLNTE